ncbi:MAG: hypothetical protein ACRDU8_02040 [Egibacteraceae bacterium]
MRLEELELVCVEAARNLAARGQRPVPTSVVLPLPAGTKVVALPQWPDDDPTRFDLLSRFARDEMRPADAPCYGFVAEAVVDPGGDPVDILLVAYGARRHRPRVTAAPLLDDGLGEFGASEDLDPVALPFLSPLQHAADAAGPPPS